MNCNIASTIQIFTKNNCFRGSLSRNKEFLTRNNAEGCQKHNFKIQLDTTL